ncbi:MAG: hypothetical protein JXA44_10315 [Methanospirillaceae archaeon]|nr:hypothetical protein [Methanospirillaceae archaeon]
MAILTVEKYEWLVYLFDALCLFLLGIFIIIISLSDPDKSNVLAMLIASLTSIVMSVYFFAEAFFAKRNEPFSLTNRFRRF